MCILSVRTCLLTAFYRFLIHTPLRSFVSTIQYNCKKYFVCMCDKAVFPADKNIYVHKITYKTNHSSDTAQENADFKISTWSSFIIMAKIIQQLRCRRTFMQPPKSKWDKSCLFFSLWKTSLWLIQQGCLGYLLTRETTWLSVCKRKP